MSSSKRDAAMEARRAQWRRIVSEFAGSGLSLRAFCRQRGIDGGVFYYWRRRLAAEEPTKGGQQSPRFLLVRPGGDPDGGNDSTLELQLDRGWRLRIPRGADAATLRSVIAALTPAP
jgi:hypothetical protein